MAPSIRVHPLVKPAKPTRQNTILSTSSPTGRRQRGCMRISTSTSPFTSVPAGRQRVAPGDAITMATAPRVANACHSAVTSAVAPQPTENLSYRVLTHAQTHRHTHAHTYTRAHMNSIVTRAHIHTRTHTPRACTPRTYALRHTDTHIARTHTHTHAHTHTHTLRTHRHTHLARAHRAHAHFAHTSSAHTSARTHTHTHTHTSHTRRHARARTRAHTANPSVDLSIHSVASLCHIAIVIRPSRHALNITSQSLTTSPSTNQRHAEIFIVTVFHHRELYTGRERSTSHRH